MSLRCRPGDQAIVIRSEWGNEGREVSVLRWIVAGDDIDASFYWDGDPCWLVIARRPFNGRPEDEFDDPCIGAFGDEQLIPIRPEREPESAPADVGCEA